MIDIKDLPPVGHSIRDEEFQKWAGPIPDDQYVVDLCVCSGIPFLLPGCVADYESTFTEVTFILNKYDDHWKRVT